jgi:hypothetical protein
MDKAMVLKFFSAKDEEQCKRNVYKYTECGAWIEFKKTGIVLGSIVEGSDEGTSNYELNYKDEFTEEDIQKHIDIIEEEANSIWEWANKENEDGKTNAEIGLDWPIL